MPGAEEFDEFYVATRRRLVLQTFALTGDLAAAQGAVRDAFVAARQHWRRVGRLDEPEDWVRPRAWTLAQRRHAARIWHKEKDVRPEEAAVLDALHQLSDIERRTLILNHLTALSLAQIGRETGATEEKTAQTLQRATASFSTRLGSSPSQIRARLQQLEPMATAVALPRASIIRRSGKVRRRRHLVAGSVGVVVLTLVAGAFVAHDTSGPSAAAGPRTDRHPVTRAMLLSAPEVSQVTPGQQWTQTETSDNTRGSGINSVCQTARFADPTGKGTLVRKFAAAGKPRRTLVQTVEISNSPTDARKAYTTTLGWFAGCTQARLQLLDAYDVSGLGDQAQLLRLRIPDASLRTYVVGIARTGSLTTSAVIETTGGKPVQVAPLMNALAISVTDLCRSDDAGSCRADPRASHVLPPPSGETKGMLADADLPPIGRIDKPWMGAAPTSGRINVAATTCDRADFGQAGAANPLTRTFLIPQAKLPAQFGLVETYGRFTGPVPAQRLISLVEKRMSTCQKRNLASTVSHARVVKSSLRGSQYASWRIDTEISKSQKKVRFWMGIVRVGNYVAQVNFSPVPGNDIDAETFQALVVRARDRLFELPSS